MDKSTDQSFPPIAEASTPYGDWTIRARLRTLNATLDDWWLAPHTEALSDLFEAMLQSRPGDRPTAAQLLQNDFLRPESRPGSHVKEHCYPSVEEVIASREALR